MEPISAIQRSGWAAGVCVTMYPGTPSEALGQVQGPNLKLEIPIGSTPSIRKPFRGSSVNHQARLPYYTLMNGVSLCQSMPIYASLCQSISSLQYLPGGLLGARLQVLGAGARCWVPDSREPLRDPLAMGSVQSVSQCYRCTGTVQCTMASSKSLCTWDGTSVKDVSPSKWDGQATQPLHVAFFFLVPLLRVLFFLFPFFRGVFVFFLLPSSVFFVFFLVHRQNQNFNLNFQKAFNYALVDHRLERVVCNHSASYYLQHCTHHVIYHRGPGRQIGQIWKLAARHLGDLQYHVWHVCNASYNGGSARARASKAIQPSGHPKTDMGRVNHRHHTQ